MTDASSTINRYLVCDGYWHNPANYPDDYLLILVGFAVE
jgi:hypothetical protein